MAAFENWVTIKTFNMSHQAMMLRSLLEAEGIDCFLKDELTVQVDPFYSNALGGAKLQVRSTDAERAIQYLKEHGHLEKEAVDDLFVQSIRSFFRKLFSSIAILLDFG